MSEIIVDINIETLILVAIWKKPSIFQGCFYITDKKNKNRQRLLFRCECNIENTMHVLAANFSPHDYKFTHLYNDSFAIDLDNLDHELKQALYLLKYALKIALEMMTNHPDNYLIDIDEAEISQISEQVEDYVLKFEQDTNNDIGFAVSIDYALTEEIDYTPALALLNINKYGKAHCKPIHNPNRKDLH